MAFNHPIIQSSKHSSNHPIIQSSNHPIIQSSNHPIIQSSNHSIIQSSKHSSNHPSIHPIKQRYPVVITFTKTHLKIPYFLLFPLSLTHATFFNHLIQ
ncbi:hypothetical protein [Helicobacter pylori]|uniref:hypothetical protein n=1 Tax=Helicobacter pylori TaxID=210 RepID=UPI00155781AC|nr:hypothetical protein [Helicobacter pylori]